MIAGCFLAGHWRRLTYHRLRNLGTEEVFYIRKILTDIGKKFIKAVKRNVRRNTFGFPPKVSLTTPYFIYDGYIPLTAGYSVGIGKVRYAKVSLRRTPLIETGQMIDQMGIYHLPTDFLNPSVFVGYLQGARIHFKNPANMFRTQPILDTYTLVSVLHNGKVIRVTDKMKQHFRKFGLMLSKDTIIIPPRPFVTMTAESEGLLNALAKKIGIYLGRIYTVNV